MHDKLKQHLEQAYEWLAKIPVSGESVDCMAMARQEMRAAFQIVNTLDEKKEAENNG